MTFGDADQGRERRCGAPSIAFALSAHTTHVDGLQVSRTVKLATAIALLLVVALVVRWCRQHHRGVEVRVHNADQHSLHHVVPLRSIGVAQGGGQTRSDDEWDCYEPTDHPRTRAIDHERDDDPGEHPNAGGPDDDGANSPVRV